VSDVIVREESPGVADNVVWIATEIVLYSASRMTIQTKSMMRRRVNRAGPSGLV
jgi:hypothetical protein